DYLLGRASELAADLGTEVARLLATTITHLCEGQLPALESAYDPTRTIEGYERSITGKTAALLATACRIGALVADLPRPIVESLTEFGIAYGMAFQVVDDILDLTATDEQLGKPAGNDLVDGIYTLPVIHSLADPAVGPELRPLLTSTIDNADRDRARELVRSGGGVQIALDVAQSWADKSAATLSGLPDTPGARALRAASTDLIERASSASH
ncbi:MAG: polyprenyl synthetase family protein, partial [Actinomycetia bacterium]|nr:polyprenyl synthetase family protein [Actinomycetes bacterium]